MLIFDRKFGGEVLASLPLAPGVYRFANASGETIYVGKSKCLRRRLAQYRLATSQKKHRRMRKVVRLASSLTWEQTPSHLDACLLEVRLIQQLRPTLNISGAFCFLYPYLGVHAGDGVVRLTMTSRPELLPEFAFHGAFRSREVCGEAFFSLMRLLTFVGHRQKIKKGALKLPRGSYVFAFRRLPENWGYLWSEFLCGASKMALSELVLRLLESVDARARAETIQAELDALVRFWKEEVLPLKEALQVTGYKGSYPVPQTDRDPLFIQARLIGATPSDKVS